MGPDRGAGRRGRPRVLPGRRLPALCRPAPEPRTRGPWALGAGATVLAVSGRPIEDRASALAMLGAGKAERFHLLVDADHRAFRDFGCYDNGPLHGLFVIDGGGVIRARYVGQAPYDDPRQVVLRARLLERLAPTAALR